MAPIEQFSEMLPLLRTAAAAIRSVYPGADQASLRVDLLVATAVAEANVRQYNAEILQEFFRRFALSFEQSSL